MELETFRAQFVGRRVLIRGQGMPTCTCGRHRVCYWASQYYYHRHGQTFSCPCLWLVCPDCLSCTVLPMRGMVAVQAAPLEADWQDVKRLTEAGWLPCTLRVQEARVAQEEPEC